MQPHPSPAAAGPSRRAAAFTLIELLVVMTVLLTAMGLVMAGSAAQERRSTAISAFTILRGVVDSCHRNAMQFGSAGLVYGFSLEYRRSPNPSAEWAWQWWNTARAVKPWVIAADGTVRYQSSVDLFADTGLGGSGALAMSGDDLRFADAMRPSREVRIDGAAQPFARATTTADILHVAFEPRSGFVHAAWTGAASLAAADRAPPFTSDGLTAGSATPSRVDIGISHLRYVGGSYVPRPIGVLAIGATGMCEFRAEARAP